ncbi:MAG TPA: lamin tail domain-containing protein, partial [Thermoplasmata archaeon]|nr:lamin tail domain-containing protein [Thermoplasmata archaeon]
PTILAFVLNPAGTEYFLVEYRSTSAFARGSAATYDKGIPGSGLLVWHVNESAYGNRVAGSLRVDLEEADGAQELEMAPAGNTGEATDPFYSGNGGQFSRTSSPNSNAYDGSANGLRLYGFGVPGATITLSYEFARILLGHETTSITMAAGAESFQQYRLFSPYGANRLVARSFAGTSNSVDLYTNRALPASASAFVDKSDTGGTSAEVLTVDSADAPPLPTSPGWWFVNVTGSPGETVSFKVESELTALYEGAERTPVGPSLNGWWENLRNLSLGGWNPSRFLRSTFSIGSGSYSYNLSYPGGTTYTCCTDTVLYSPLLNLTRNSAPVLSFRTSYNFQCGEVSGGGSWRCDGFWFEASVAGSGVWSLISPVGDYPTNLDSDGLTSNTLHATYSGLPGQKAFTQESGGWQRYTFYLSGYSGQNIFLRIRSWANPAGWYVPGTGQFLYLDQISLTSRIVINEVLAAESVRREFVEIHNPFGVAVDLDGWRIRDGNGGLDFTIPSALDPLAANAYLWLQGGSGTDDYVSTDGIAIVHTGVNGVLAEADDSVTLSDDRGGEVDFVRFGSSANDLPAFAFWTGTAPPTTGLDDSYGRDQNSLDTDASSDWDTTGGVDAAGPTPGGRNLGPAIPESGLVAVAAVAGVIAIGVRISSSRRRKGTL